MTGKTTYRGCRDCFKSTKLPATECEHCGSDTSFKEVTTDYNTVHTSFPSGYFRDIDYDPVYIKGRGDLREETRRRGQVSEYAEC